jgi:hypothetical protein
MEDLYETLDLACMSVGSTLKSTRCLSQFFKYDLRSSRNLTYVVM